MSESLGRAVLELVADLNPLKAQLAEGEAATKEMAASSARSFKGGITRTALPAAAALGVVAIAMHKSVEAASEDQKSQARLEAAFKANKVEIGEYKDKIEEAEQAGIQLGFHTNDTRDAIGTLVTAFGNGKKAIDLLSTAQDIARFKHIGLADAAKILTSASAGSTRAARQLGIAVATTKTNSNDAALAYAAQTRAIKAQYPATSKMTDAQKKQQQAQLDALKTKYVTIKADAALKDKQLTSAKVIDLVNKKLHGQADAYAKTATGAKERLGAEVERLEVSLGNALLPALTAVTTALADAAGWMQKHSTIAKVAIGIIAGVAAAILAVNLALKLQATYTKLAAAAQWIYATAMKALGLANEEATVATEGQTAAQTGLNVAMDANPIGLIVLALVALGVALYEAWQHSATFRAIVYAVWNTLKGQVSAVLHFFIKTIPAAFNTVLNWVKGHWKLIAVLISGPFAPLVALATNAFGVRSALVGAFNTMWGAAKSVWKGLSAFWKAMWSGAWAVVRGYVNLIIGGVNFLISAIDAIKLPAVGFTIFGHHVGFGGWGGFAIPTVPTLDQGGDVVSTGLAVVHRGESFSGVHGEHWRGAEGNKIEVNVHGVVGNPREVALTIGRELQKLKTRGVDFGLA